MIFVKYVGKQIETNNAEYFWNKNNFQIYELNNEIFIIHLHLNLSNFAVVRNIKVISSFIKHKT